MTQSKHTKRALLASVLSVVVCCALLIGSTFAWFTDKVESGNNRIVAGNLDVELYQVKGDTEERVTADTNLFAENALWEPGHTEVVYLRVKNEGTLALKYKFSINVAGKVIGKTADGADIDLSDYIKFGVVEGLTAAYPGDAAGRTAAREAVEDEARLISEGYSSTEGHLTAKGTAADTSGLIAIVVYMPEGVGNTANHGTDSQAPSIQMGINLVATQDTVESDSFDDQYDADAVYPVWDGSVDTTWYDAQNVKTAYTLSRPSQLAGLAQLVNKGTAFENVTITLAANLFLDNKEWTPIGQKASGRFFQGTFDGGGKTISGLKISAENNNDTSTFDGYAALFGAAQNAEIKNLTVSGEVDAQNAAGIVARANAGTNIHDCVSNVTVNGSIKAGGIACLTNAGGVTITDCINNGTVAGGDDGLGGIVGFTNPDTAITGCTNTGTIGAEASRYAGGIVGYASGSFEEISSCQNSGTIRGGLDVGGIIGIATGEGNLEDCTNAGAIIGTDDATCGGIVGSAARTVMKNCNNTGTVSGRIVGGVTGDISAGTVDSCSGGTADLTGTYAGRLIGAVSNQPNNVTYATLRIDDSNGDAYTSLPTVGIMAPQTAWAYLHVLQGTYQNMELTQRGGNEAFIYDYVSGHIYHWVKGTWEISGSTTP